MGFRPERRCWRVRCGQQVLVAGACASGARILPIKNRHLERHARLQSALRRLLAGQRPYALPVRHDDAWADIRPHGSVLSRISTPCDVRFAPNSDRESGHAAMVMSALPPKADIWGAARDVR